MRHSSPAFIARKWQYLLGAMVCGLTAAGLAAPATAAAICQERLNYTKGFDHDVSTAQMVFITGVTANDICAASSAVKTVLKDKNLPERFALLAKATQYGATGKKQAIADTHLIHFVNGYEALIQNKNELARTEIQQYFEKLPEQQAGNNRSLNIAASVIAFWAQAAIDRKAFATEQTKLRQDALEQLQEQEEEGTPQQTEPSEAPRFTLDVEPIRELGLWSYYALAIEAGLAGEDPFPLYNLALLNIGDQSPQSIIWFVARQTQVAADYNQIITGFAPVATWRYRALDAHIETFGPLNRRALIEQYIADLVLLSAGLENYILAQTVWNAPNKKTANYNPTNRAFLRFVLAERLYETGRADDVVRILAPISKPAQKSEQFPDILAPHAITAKNIAAVLHAEFYTTQVNETDRLRTRAIDRRTRFKRAERERVNTLETNSNTQARATERRGGIYGGGSNEIDTLDLYALEKGIETLTEQITTLDANIAQNSTRANELFDATTTQPNLSKSDNAFLHRAKGRWLTQRKQYTQSVAAIDKALLYIDPVQNPNGQNDLLYAQAVNYERLGDWDTAERLFRESLESQPENPGVLNYLGYSLLLYRPERIDEATTMIARANSLTKSNSGAILDSLGYAYLLDGRIEEAVDLLESASARLPYSTEVLLHLGDAYWENGRIREAVFQWQRALEELSHSYENIDEAAIEERIARGHEKLDKSR